MALMKVLILGISGLIGNGIASVISKDKSKTLIGTYCKNKHYHQLSDNLFSANSNDNFVRVEFSKNRFAILIPFKEGTFLIGLSRTSLNI